ncbi:hypothetical protein ACBR40_34685 [Nonomuraea sp. AD125B]|uniref:hypothetical protein n=1 Tax=Nonomuraea sp. AD125B TaxID=3242897 RepID=UPI0035285C59
METRQPKARLAAAFLAKGTQLAAALFLSGLKGLIFFAAIRGYDPDVAAAYGVGITVTLAVSMLGAGLNVVAVQKLAGVDVHEDTRERRHRLSAIGATAVSSALLLTLALLAAGAVLALVGDGLTSLFFWCRMPGVLVIPLQGVVTGALVASGREGAALRTSMENLVLNAAAAAILPVLSLSPPAALIAIAVYGTLADTFTLIRQLVRLGRLGSHLLGAVRSATPVVVTQPLSHLRGAWQAAAGASDGLIMMGSFALITLAAAQVDNETAMTVTALISLMRTIIIPLKSYGLVGGRMAMAPGHGLRPDQRVNLYAAVIAGLLLPLSLTMIFAPDAMLHLIGLEAASGPAVLAVRLAGAQLLLEPITGFGAAALKILVGPSAAMTALLISMAGVALPVVAVLLVSADLSVASIWGALLAARICFALQVLRRYRSWRRGALATVMGKR